MKRLGKKGFTIIELLIALSFFSFLLMALTVGFVQINRAYTKGITVKTIQESGRLLMNDITQAIRSSGDGSVTVSASPYRLCIGNIRYGWNQVTNTTNGDRSNEVFVTDTTPQTNTTEVITLTKTEDNANCDARIPKIRSELAIDRRAIVQDLSVTKVANRAWRVSLILSTSETSDLAKWGVDAECKEQVGNQFCDIAKFETIVSVRN